MATSSGNPWGPVRKSGRSGLFCAFMSAPHALRRCARRDILLREALESGSGGPGTSRHGRHGRPAEPTGILCCFQNVVPMVRIWIQYRSIYRSILGSIRSKFDPINPCLFRSIRSIRSNFDPIWILIRIHVKDYRCHCEHNLVRQVCTHVCCRLWLICHLRVLLGTTRYNVHPVLPRWQRCRMKHTRIKDYL